MKKIISIAMAVAMLLSVLGLVSAAEIFKGDSTMTLDVVEIQSDGVTLLMNWNCKADNVYDPNSTRDDLMAGVYSYAAIRLTDENYNLQWIGDVPLQWGGYMDYPYGWAEGNIMSFKVTEATLGCADIHDIFKLVRPGGKFEGMKVCFCLEENGTAIKGDGIVQCYFEQGKYDWEVENGVNWCISPKAAEEGMYDGLYFILDDIWLEADSIADSEKESRKAAETTAPDDTTAAPADDTTAAPADDTTAGDNTDDGEDGSSSLWIYIAIAAAVVIAAVVVAIILGKKKK